ncbi:MAG: MoxR family ATPase [Anaerolineae bacterium]|nr:MoxR family ATPase [Anaerolineae bacterium]
MESVQTFAEKVINNVEKAIIGKHQVVEQTLIALLCQGHVLIEDVPGTGKTTLALAVARSTGCSFRRLQFTPDMLPSDVTGVSVFNQKTREFEFRPGPVFAQIVLTDEINRATPKTQSALLEAMEERQVTVDGHTYPMELPFLVLATQNPIEYEGTFPLPEAQLDRFMLRINLGYPDKISEMNILSAQQFTHPITTLQQVVTQEELLEVQKSVRQIYVDDLVKTYIIDLCTATREHPDVYLGASPRGSLALYRTGQILAAIRQRDYVIPDDVKYLAESTLAHRLIISPAARIKNITAKDVIRDILTSVPVPGARVTGKDGRQAATQKKVFQLTP